MNRVRVIQKLIDSNKYRLYLEIGTWKGDSLFPLRCYKKIAIDPKFKFSKAQKVLWMWKNTSNIQNEYFEMTSDDFFLYQKSYLKRIGKLDIVFIDGLHTFRATLNDILNSLRYLQKDGVIICHDCYPPHKASSISAENLEDAIIKGAKLNGWNGQWCGDSWKAIYYLRKVYSSQLDVSVLNLDFGLGIIKLKSIKNLEYKINEDVFLETDKLDYQMLKGNPEEVIGLINDIEPFV